MHSIPHLVQYQGSKRNIAPQIIKYFPQKFNRLIEPFCGTCAVSILTAAYYHDVHFLVNDINKPLVELMKECVNSPERLTQDYSVIWNGQFLEGENNIDYFYKVRDEFNSGLTDPARTLFILARVVKGAVRYNAAGQMNQSCDKRRFGTKPSIIEKNANNISSLLKGRIEFQSLDYKEILSSASMGDLIYMDPPYQGTSNFDNPRDNRYIQGVSFDEFSMELMKLNQRNIDYVVSYDGKTGDKVIGKNLPDALGLNHIYIDAGTSAQATLNGKHETTYESLYLSNRLTKKEDFVQLKLAI